MSARTLRQAQGRLFRIGTRGSRLALRQTEIVVGALQQAHPALRFQIKPIRTTGDKRVRAPLAKIGGRGLFVKELEQALLHRDIDVAVHSLKDLPTEDADGLIIAAISQREDARDVFVSRDGRKLADLPSGSTVGSGSPRRAAQLRAFRPDLQVVDIRGNVETRLRKVEQGLVAGVIVAAAGLARLGCLERAAEILPLDVMLPAVGPGALALQARADDGEAIELARAADHEATRLATVAERAFLRHLGGGCQAAIAALAMVADSVLRLRGLVADPDGGRLLRGHIEGEAREAEALGQRLADQLLAEGAVEVLEARA